jgi:hypothetical protein
MTKLTVAEASERGYATSLTILQAVQKSWLPAEKRPDGKILVDADDLERLCGRPVGPTHASHKNRMVSGALEEAEQTIADGTFDSDTPVFAEDVEDEPEPDEGWGTGPAATTPAEEDRHDEGRILRAEIARLQHELAAGQRRTAALLDVLAGRLVPAGAATGPSPAIGGDDTREETASTGMPAAADAEAAQADAADQPGDDVVDAAESPAPDTEAPVGGADRSESGAPEPFDAEAGSSAGDDLAMPVLTARPENRPVAPARAAYARPEPASSTSSFVWKIWFLVAFVRIGLIGALFWYAADLGGDLWVLAQWVRGEQAAGTPQFAAATQAVLRAARDTLGPPAILLLVMLIARAVFRAFRR